MDGQIVRHVIERQVGADPSDPRPKRPLGIVLVQPLKAAQECFLGHVLRFLPVAEHPVAGAKHPILVPPNKLTVGVEVPAAGQPDKFLLGGIGHGALHLDTGQPGHKLQERR